MITIEQLKAAAGVTDQNILKGINDTLEKYAINTPLRINHFLAQLMHESMNFKAKKENLNYSSKGLLTTFKKYFINEAATIPYARNQAKIGNRVYADRMGNGNEASGDGYRYCGRGYIQITGKDNYKRLSEDTHLDFLTHPELLEQPEYAALSAGWFWNKNNLNVYADKDDIITVTKRINGGTNGLAERKANLAKLKSIIK